MKKLETREWVFVLLIVILIQFIIQASAWLYGGNSGALGYLSFAGTAVSIILAVLAIMYSFLQSSSQEKSSANISTQVTKLVDVVQNIEVSKEALTGTLEQLDGVTKKLDLTIEHQGHLRKEVSHLHKAFKGFERATTGYQTSDTSVYAQPFKSGFNGLSLMLVFVYYGEKINSAVDDVVDDLVMPVLSEMSSTDEESFGFMAAYNRGAFMTVYQLLTAIDCLEIYKDRTFTLHPTFLQECENFLEYAHEEDSEIDPMIKKVINKCEVFVETFDPET